MLSTSTIAEASQQRVSGTDQVSGVPGGYAAGFRMNANGNMGPHFDSFGHDGWGGNVAYADKQERLGVAYVTNRMVVPGPGESDKRLSRLLNATYSALRA